MICVLNFSISLLVNLGRDGSHIVGEFKHEVRQFQKPYDNQQAEQISLIVKNVILKSKFGASVLPKSVNIAFFLEMVIDD